MDSYFTCYFTSPFLSLFKWRIIAIARGLFINRNELSAHRFVCHIQSPSSSPCEWRASDSPALLVCLPTPPDSLSPEIRVFKSNYIEWPFIFARWNLTPCHSFFSAARQPRLMQNKQERSTTKAFRILICILIKSPPQGRVQSALLFSDRHLNVSLN